MHATLVNQAGKDPEISAGQELRKCPGCKAMTVKRPIIITRLKPEAKGLKEQVAPTPAKEKKVHTTVVLKVVSLKRVYSDKAHYDDMAAKPNFYLYQWACYISQAVLRKSIRDSFQRVHKSGAGGGRARTIGNHRVDHDAVPALTAGSGKPLMLDGKQQSGMRPMHVKGRVLV